MENITNSPYSWDVIKEKIKETNPDITDSDLVLNHGNSEELFETLSKKLNMSKPEVKSWIESLASTKSIAG